MKYQLSKKDLSKKTASILIVIFFLTMSTNQCIADTGTLEEPSCYGFIVPSVKLENFSLEKQINCKINHMINDLLREQIPVYWTATNGTASIKEIRSDIGDQMFFEKGTFLIPFTGNLTDDKKIMAIVYDYNQSSEIEEDNSIKIPIFLLTESLNIEAHLLYEVKIAQVVNYMTTWEEHWYLERAEECGFLTFNPIEDRDLGKKLNNNDYNVIIWPGATADIRDGYVSNTLKAELKLHSPSEAIRKFVRNGGGYIGSCYGAFVASSGVPPIYFKRRANNPNLRSFILLAIADVLTTRPMIVQEVEMRIVNDSHPVTYGLNQVIINLFYMGPKFVYIGKNSESLAVFQNSSSSLDNTPSWVSSKFGKGRVILFSPHPEMVAVDLQMRDIKHTIISNALYYTTYKETIDLQMSQSNDLSFIIKTWETTGDLTNGLSERDELFDKTKIEINEILDILNNLQFYYTDLYTRYLINTNKTLNTIEKIYPLLKNDADFIQSLMVFKKEISTKVNETKAIFIKAQEKLNKYMKTYNLIRPRYEPFEPFLRLKLFLIKRVSSEVYEPIRKGQRVLPQIHLDSLKFLRHHWYNYESNVEV